MLLFSLLIIPLIVFDPTNAKCDVSNSTQHYINCYKFGSWSKMNQELSSISNMFPVDLMPGEPIVLSVNVMPTEPILLTSELNFANFPANS
jgi:hypothetical protein